MKTDPWVALPVCHPPLVNCLPNLAIASPFTISMPHYARPPIVEAVFGVRFTLNQTDPEVLMELQETFRPDLPIAQKLFATQFSIVPGPTGVTAQSTSGTLAKVQYSKSDRSRVLQLGLDGLSYHVVGGYKSWEVHFEEFMSFCRALFLVHHPNSFVGVEVRFINKIDTPPDTDTNEYLKGVPVVPPELPHGFNTFLYRLSITPQPSIDANIIIGNEPANSNGCSYVFDIGLTCNDIDTVKDEIGRERIFTTMRLEKNRIFEAFLTDASRGLFNPDPSIT